MPYVPPAAASGGAPSDATYITQTSNGTLSAEQALSALSTGLAVVTNGTGVVTSVAAPSGTVVGTSDAQTLTGKVLSDAFMGNSFMSQSALVETATLLASTDFLYDSLLEIGSGISLELPATSTLEITAYATQTTIQTLANKTLTQPTITDFTNATHTHAATATGGTLNGANAIQAATLTATQMQFGMVYRRQGGTTGVGSWASSGTSNTDTSTTGAFFQFGANTTSATSGTDTTVTFPVAFNQTPLVWVTIISANTSNEYATVNTITTTTFKQRQLTGTSAEGLAWGAVGQ